MQKRENALHINAEQVFKPLVCTLFNPSESSPTESPPE